MAVLAMTMCTVGACAPDNPGASKSTERTDALITQYDQAFKNHTGFTLGDWLQQDNPFDNLESMLESIYVKGTSASDFALQLVAGSQPVEVEHTPSHDAHAVSGAKRVDNVLNCSRERTPGIPWPTYEEVRARGSLRSPSFNLCGDTGRSVTSDTRVKLKGKLGHTQTLRRIDVRISHECHYMNGCIRGLAPHFGLMVTVGDIVLYNLHWSYYLLERGKGGNVSVDPIVCWTWQHVVGDSYGGYDIGNEDFRGATGERCKSVSTNKGARAALTQVITDQSLLQQAEVKRVRQRLEDMGFDLDATAIDILEAAATNAPWYAVGGALVVLKYFGKFVLGIP